MEMGDRIEEGRAAINDADKRHGFQAPPCLSVAAITYGTGRFKFSSLYIYISIVNRVIFNRNYI